ncbi:MAG: stage III sporulation protein AD [Syntrophomonadaceae bacterium]|nr:stage III sporulation protein AD [Syntrophomonadaceae bacterium]
MDITQVVGLALLTMVFTLILRQQRPVMAVLLAIVFSVLVFLAMMSKLALVVTYVQELSRRAEINQFFLPTILKILGVAYLGELAAAICEDAGEKAIAKKVEFAAKIIIAVISLPVMMAILDSLLRLLPG